MSIFHPRLAFKGARSYIHGTSLYEAVIEGAHAGPGAPDGPLSVDFRRQLQGGAEIHYVTGTAADIPKDATGTFRLTCRGDSVTGWIQPSGEPVNERVDYDESVIRNTAEIDGEAVRQTAAPAFLPIEVCTSMGVMLHNHLFPLDAQERWLLARIQLVRPLATEDILGMTLTCHQNMNGRITRSGLHTGNGQSIGTLAFMAAGL